MCLIRGQLSQWTKENWEMHSLAHTSCITPDHCLVLARAMQEYHSKNRIFFQKVFWLIHSKVQPEHWCFGYFQTPWPNAEDVEFWQVSARNLLPAWMQHTLFVLTSAVNSKFSLYHCKQNQFVNKTVVCPLCATDVVGCSEISWAQGAKLAVKVDLLMYWCVWRGCSSSSYTSCVFSALPWVSSSKGNNYDSHFIGTKLRHSGKMCRAL